MQTQKGNLLLARARAQVSSNAVEWNKGPEFWIPYTFIQMVLCFCNSIADWLNRTRAGLLNLASLSGLAWVWCGHWAMGIFLIGLATLPAGLPLRACPGFSLVLTFPPVFSYIEESSSLFWGRAWYCCLSIISWMVLTWSFTKATSLVIMHGPKVSINSSTIRGPTRVEISIVNHRDCWNQNSN